MRCRQAGSSVIAFYLNLYELSLPGCWFLFQIFIFCFNWLLSKFFSCRNSKNRLYTAIANMLDLTFSKKLFPCEFLRSDFHEPRQRFNFLPLCTGQPRLGINRDTYSHPQPQVRHQSKPEGRTHTPWQIPGHSSPLSFPVSKLLQQHKEGRQLGWL